MPVEAIHSECKVFSGETSASFVDDGTLHIRFDETDSRATMPGTCLLVSCTFLHFLHVTPSCVCALLAVYQSPWGFSQTDRQPTALPNWEELLHANEGNHIVFVSGNFLLVLVLLGMQPNEGRYLVTISYRIASEPRGRNVCKTLRFSSRIAYWIRHRK